MNSTFLPTEIFALSTEGQHFVDGVNAEFTAIEAGKAAHAQQLDALHESEANPAGMRMSEIQKQHVKLRDVHAELLQREIALLRKVIGLWPGIRFQERQDRFQSLGDLIAKARQRVARELERIGYIDVDPNSRIVGLHPSIAKLEGELVAIELSRLESFRTAQLEAGVENLQRELSRLVRPAA